MTRADTALDQATALRDRGWRPFPLDHPDLPNCVGAGHPDGRRCPAGTHDKRGKHPVIAWGGATRHPVTDGSIRAWFGRGLRNIGIACKGSGLLVFDEDVDGALHALAAEHGHTLPVTYRVRTARGWHTYYEAPTGRIVGNKAGPILSAAHIDVRGGAGDGGYVVAAGSVHVSGHVYVAEDDHVMPAPAPAWLLDLIDAETVADANENSSSGATSSSTRGDGERWTDDPRPGTAATLHAQYRRHLDAVRTRGGEFRHELFLAARDAWRLRNLDLLTQQEFDDDLAAAIYRVWGAGPDADDEAIALDEARNAAAESPWVLVDPYAGPTVAALSVGESARPDTASADAWREVPRAELRSAMSDADYAEVQRRMQARVEQQAALDLDEALRKERLRRQVRRAVDAEEAPPLPDLDDLIVWDEDLEHQPAPAMAVKELIPERSVGWLGGPSGTYKSFVALQLAYSLAHGRPALEHDRFAVTRPRKVMYVAGEDAPGVMMRARAVRTRMGVPGGRHVAIYKQPLDLTSQRDVDHLMSRAIADGIEFLMIDTFRQSTLGVNENDNTEVGLILGRLIALRDQHGVSSVLLDHTNKSAQGLADLGGAGAKRANADFVLMIDLPNGDRAPDQQRVLRTAKLKNLPDGRTWPIRLEQVDEVTDDDGNTSAVAVVGTVTASGDLHDRGSWADVRTSDLPERVRLIESPYPRAVHDVYRVLSAIDDEDGLTTAQVLAVLAEGPRAQKRTAVYAAVSALKSAGVVEAIGARLHVCQVP